MACIRLIGKLLVERSLPEDCSVGADVLLVGLVWGSLSRCSLLGESGVAECRENEEDSNQKAHSHNLKLYLLEVPHTLRSIALKKQVKTRKNAVSACWLSDF